MKFWSNKKIFIIIWILGVFILSIPSDKVMAAKKGKTPQITCALSTKNAKKGYVKLKISVKDDVGLKVVKYAEGRHRKPFFKYSFYKKNVKNVKLSSAKKLRFELEVKDKSFYSFYIENKKRAFIHKTFLIDLKTSKEETEKKVSEEDEKKEETSNNDVEVKEEKEPKKEGGIKEENNMKNQSSQENGVIEEKKNEGIVKEPEIPLYTIDNETRAVWVTFLEYSDKGYTETGFKKMVNGMFNEIAGRRLNNIYIHVRPFSDAMYESKYFPWSRYASGLEGKNPGFDPLKIMVKEAHSRGIKIHAYINPYRVNVISKFEALDDSDYSWKNPAYRWLNDDEEENDRNVLKHDKMYYYNPSKQEVIDLITNGVKEIAEGYDVDGVIFDDYFYPNLGTKYKKNFDSIEYEEYKENNEISGVTSLSIEEWRRENINKMVRSVYQVVKAAGKGQLFGISPAGNLQRLRANNVYYADVDKWGSEEGFVDYIAPQLYWGFEHKIVPFEKAVSDWMAVVKNPNIKLYIAMAMHNVQAQESPEWKKKDILARMLKSLREKNLEGYSIYRYHYMTDKYLTKPGAKEARDLLFELIK